MEPPSSSLDGGRLPSILVYLGCLSVLAHVFGAHCNFDAIWLIATGKRVVVWSQFCSSAVFFLSWILVFFSGTLASHGFGAAQTAASCSIHIISMLAFYCAIKIFLHGFLVDRAYTVWTAGTADAHRFRSRLWLGGMLSILVYPGLLVLNIFGRTLSIDDAGQCLIGFTISSTAPTLAWSGLLVVAFALIFAYPLRRTTPAQTSNPMIRTISYRTLIASLVAFLAGAVNVALFIGLGQQPTWIYGISTVLDLTLGAFALHRISDDAAHLAAAEVRRGSLSHALGLPLRDVGLGGEVFLPSLPLASPGLMSHGSEDDHERYYPTGFNVPRSPTKTTSTSAKDKDKQKGPESPTADKDKSTTGGPGSVGVGGGPKADCASVGEVLPTVAAAMMMRRDTKESRRSWKEWIFPSAAPSAAHWPPVPLPASVLQATAAAAASGSAVAPRDLPTSLSDVDEETDAKIDLECGEQRDMIAPWEMQALPPWQQRLRNTQSFGSRPSTAETVKPRPSPLVARTSISSRQSATAASPPPTPRTQYPTATTPTAPLTPTNGRLRSNSSSSTVDNLKAPRTWSCSPIVFSRTRRSRIGPSGLGGMGDDYSDVELDLDSDFASLTPSLEEEFGPRGRSMSFSGESIVVGARKMSGGGTLPDIEDEEGAGVDAVERNGDEVERMRMSVERSNDWSYRTLSKVDVMPPPSTSPPR